MTNYCKHNRVLSECYECTPSPDQVDAFTEPRARSTDPETSKAAGRAVKAGKQRDRIMDLLRSVPSSVKESLCGLTADEIDAAFGVGWRLTTAGRRLSELKRRGLVEKCGERKTRSGRMATVYRATS